MHIQPIDFLCGKEYVLADDTDELKTNESVAQAVERKEAEEAIKQATLDAEGFSLFNIFTIHINTNSPSYLYSGTLFYT